MIASDVLQLVAPAVRNVFQNDGDAQLRRLLAKPGQHLDVPADHLLLLEELRRLAEMDVHDRGTDPVAHAQGLPELGQARLPDAAERGTERQKPGGVRHDTEAVTVEGRTNGNRVDLVRVGSGRLQGEVHEVEAVLPDPVDLFQRVAGRVVHRTDLHGTIPLFDSDFTALSIAAVNPWQTVFASCVPKGSPAGPMDGVAGVSSAIESVTKVRFGPGQGAGRGSRDWAHLVN